MPIYFSITAIPGSHPGTAVSYMDIFISCSIEVKSISHFLDILSTPMAFKIDLAANTCLKKRLKFFNLTFTIF